jgi:hypothetical protein
MAQRALSTVIRVTLVLLLSIVGWGPLCAQQSGLPPQPVTDDASAAAPKLELVPGYYDLSYSDALLGEVAGEALVADDGTVTVTYRNPVTGESFVLKGAAPRIEEEQLILSLEGRSPHGERRDGSELPGRFLVTTPEQPIRIVAGEREITHEVDQRDPADEDRVELRLTLTEEGALAGTWSYRADPVTFRDSGGYGRLGELVEQDGKLQMVGVEHWARQGTVVLGALVVHDQSGLSGGRWDYPFDQRFARADDPPHLQGQFKRRVVMVYGRNLPKTHDDLFDLVEADPTLDYELWGLDADQFKDHGGPDPAVVRRDFRLGWERLLAQLPPEEHAKTRKLDALLLRATLLEGVEPGWHDFALNGAPARWQLLFGNVRAEISFVRHYGADEFEASREFLLPETVYIEVRLPAITAITEIPVALAIDGTFFSFDGEPTIPAYYVGLALPDQASLIRGLELGPPPTVYRTGPLRFVGGTEDDTIRLEPGQRLHAKVAHAGVLQGVSGIAEARIIAKTTDALAGRGVGPWFLGDDLWEMALDRVARCHGLRFGPPWRGQEGLAVERVANLLVVERELRELSIAAGHHAAMLLLRDGFVALMREQLAALEVMDDPASVLGFRSLMREASHSANLPLGRRLVSVPDGEPQPFALTFHLAEARALLGYDEDQASAWALAATREVMRGYADEVRKALQIAQAVDECALRDLLMLTGFGFDPVVRLLRPWLMLPDRDAQGIVDWLPDHVARGYVLSLATLAEAVRDQEAFAAIDTQVVLLAASAVALPALYFQSAWLGHLVAHGALSARAGAAASHAISAFGLAVDVADLSQVVFEEIPESLRSRAEARFALGAAAVLGTGRLMMAEAEQQSWAGTAAAVLLGSYGGYRGLKQLGEIPDVYQFARWGPNYLAMQRGAALVERFSGQGLAGMTRRQRLDLLRFLEDADVQRRVAGAAALSALQRKGLEAFDGALSVWLRSGDTPPWALTLDNEVLRALAPVIRRPDVVQLYRAEEAALVALLKGAHSADAQLVLLSYPARSLAEIETRMLTLRQRVREAVPGLYRVSDLAPDARVDELLRANGIATRVLVAPGSADANSVTLILSRAEDLDAEDLRASFVRSFDRTSGALTFEIAFLERAPPMLEMLPVDLLPGRGTPTTTFLNLAAMNHFGIGFGGSGAPLRSLKLSSVVNVENNFHLTWLFDTYGHDIPQAALRELPSVKYAESALNQAGYEIVGITPVLRGVGRVDVSSGRWGYRDKDSFNSALELFFGDSQPAGKTYLDWLNIEIEVRPIGP